MDIDKTDTTKNIADLFPKAGVTAVEQQAMYGEIGELMLRSSLLRLFSELNEEQESALNHYLDTNPDPGKSIVYLFEHSPLFQKIFEEEVLAFKQEAQTILE